MEELKITKEKVLEASERCGTAKEVLKTLFPEVFEEETIEPSYLGVYETENHNTAIYFDGIEKPIWIYLDHMGWDLAEDAKAIKKIAGSINDFNIIRKYRRSQ